MSLFDNIPEPKEEDKYLYVWEELLPKDFYTKEEWKNMTRNPSNTHEYKKIKRVKETNYYGRS